MRLQLPEFAAVMTAFLYGSYQGLFPKDKTKILDGDESDVRKAEGTKLYTKVVIYYAHWCGHCRNTADELIKNQNVFYNPKTFYDEENLPRVVAFDCVRDDEANEFCGKQGVNNYPTVFTYLKGERYGNPGPLVDYIRMMLEKTPVLTTTKPLPSTTTTTSSAHTTTSIPSTSTRVSSTTTVPTAISTTTISTSTGITTMATSTTAMATTTSTTTPTGGSLFPDDANVTYEMRILDGILAFAYALHTATFFPANTTLIVEKLRILKENLLPVIVSVHPDKEFRKDVSGLLGNISKSSDPITKDQWMAMLDGIAPRRMRQQPDAFWKHCKNFNCGLWQFFHALTLGVDMKFSATTAKDSNGKKVMETIKSFVTYFFMCHSCAQHFIKGYDNCVGERCTMPNPDRRHTALWLWRVHNMVNNRTSHERGITGKDTAWPTRNECTQCREYKAGTNDFVFNEDNVMEFLDKSYFNKSTDKPSGSIRAEVSGAINHRRGCGSYS